MSATIDALEDLGACQPALNWCEDQPRQGAEALWRACENPEWLAWIIGVAYPTSGGEFNSMLREARGSHTDALVAANNVIEDVIEPARGAYNTAYGAARRVHEGAIDSAYDALWAVQARLVPARAAAILAANGAYQVRLAVVEADYRFGTFPSEEAYNTARDAAGAMYRAACDAAKGAYHTAYDKSQDEYRRACDRAAVVVRLVFDAAGEAYDAAVEPARVGRDLALRGAHKTYCDAIRSVFKRPTIRQLLKVAAERIDDDIPF
jgi:hypothetical protein